MGNSGQAAGLRGLRGRGVAPSDLRCAGGNVMRDLLAARFPRLTCFQIHLQIHLTIYGVQNYDNVVNACCFNLHSES